MIRLAFRNLFQSKTRLLISVGGVALALLLILSLDAIFAGVERQVTAYIDNSGADIFVAQKDVRNMHMAASAIPTSIIGKVKGIEGVEDVTPILYLSNMVVAGSERNLAYIIGIPKDAQMGGVWNLASGHSQPGEGEAIIDRSVAEKSGVGLGDSVQILGRQFTIVGLSVGTANIVNSVAFISLEDFQTMRGSPGVVSFLLVKIDPGESAEAMAARIEAGMDGVTALPRTAFAAQERRVVKDMSTDVITMMNMIGFLIGLAVMALTVYTATLSRRKEFGVLKALGARNVNLYQAVLAQALMSVLLGFAMGVTLVWLLSGIIPRLGLVLSLEISQASLLKVGGTSIIIAALSAILPIRQIAGLDPAIVFRGK